MDPPLPPRTEVLLVSACAPTHKSTCAGAQGPVCVGYRPALPAFGLPVCICRASAASARLRVGQVCRQASGAFKDGPHALHQPCTRLVAIVCLSEP